MAQLTKTKQFNTGRQDYNNAPKMPKDWDKNYDRGNASNVIAAAHRYPTESLGYALGSWLGNYIDRGQTKEANNYADNLYRDLSGGTLGQFAQQSGQSSANDANNMIRNTYGGMNTNQAAQDYIAQGTPVGATSEQNAGGQQATQAGQLAQMQAQQAMMNGMPVTAAGAAAMGLSPKDRAQQELLDYKMNDFAENGPNPSAARRDETKVRQAMDEMPRMNLIFGNRQQFMDEAEKRVRGSKLSYNRQNEVLARIAAKYDAERGAQAEQYATQLYGKWLQTNPEEFEKEYMPQLLQFAQAGNLQQASPLLDAMAAQKVRVQKIQDERDKMALQHEYDINKIYAQKEAAAMYGTGSKGSKKGTGSTRLDQALADSKLYSDLAAKYKDAEGYEDIRDQARAGMKQADQDIMDIKKAQKILQGNPNDYETHMKQLQVMRDLYGWTRDDYMNSNYYEDANQDYRDYALENIFPE